MRVFRIHSQAFRLVVECQAVGYKFGARAKSSARVNADFRFEISNLKFGILNLKSQITNLKSEICDFRFYFPLIVLISRAPHQAKLATPHPYLRRDVRAVRAARATREPRSRREPVRDSELRMNKPRPAQRGLPLYHSSRR